MTVVAPWSGPVDLDNCASEPIHIPGAIQPHGVLIAVTEPDLTIAVVSANIDLWFGQDAAGAIGRDLGALIGDEARAVVDSVRTMDWVQRFDEVDLIVDGRRLIATLYRSGPYLVIELEADGPDDRRASPIVREAAMALQTGRSVMEVADASARWIRALTGFDRVMVYRFDADWNGEVVAERKRSDLNAFIGLHYPASDIPVQARELYRRNWLRVIPDVGYRPEPLVPPVAFDTAAPLDLSGSTLRSVSPIHVEYLANMGVGASMSVSIVINGELWGLIACHHYSGSHHVSVQSRNAAQFLAQLISLRISETLDADARARTIELTATADLVAQAFAAATQSGIDQVLHRHEDDVLAIADATGFVMRVEGVVDRLGVTPPDHVIDAIVGAWPQDHEVFATDRLGELCPAALDHLDSAGGVLAFALTNDRSELVAWFLPELVQTVDWGGDPHNAKLAADESDNVRLSPRKSFARWRETISGRSAPWDESVVDAADRFIRHLRAAMLRNERDSASLAKDLQRVMRPATLPSVVGYELSVFAQSAGRGEIGGDWYDALPVGDDQIAIVVGDVAGHGLGAASEMAQLRNVMRAYLTEDPDPPRSLDRLDRYMQRYLPGSIATVVCAVIDTATSEMHISHGGHVPALIVDDADASFVPLDGDPLLGFRVAQRTQRHFTLLPGDTVVLYSDGLVETRRLSLDDGLAILQREAADILRTNPSDSQALRLAARLLTDEHHDDISLLLVRRTDRTPPPAT